MGSVASARGNANALRLWLTSMDTTDDRRRNNSQIRCGGWRHILRVASNW